MSFRDRVQGLIESAGYTVRPVEEVQRLEETYTVARTFADEAEELALHAMDYLGGRPQEMSYESRRRLAQRSRIALLRDPVAGTEAELKANFAFGRGIGVPQATDDRVQEIINEAWSDPVNERKLTSFAAQRRRSNELLTQANLFPVLFSNEQTGHVRVGFLDHDLVTDVVTHPDDDELPMWYVARKRKAEWDFENHYAKPDTTQYADNGTEKVWYYQHWRHVEDAEAWARAQREPIPERPRDEDIAEGLVEHFQINWVGRTQFGVPPWARVLRYFSALNQLAEAQVQMRQAASSIYAKRTRKGGPRDLVKAASNVTKMAGDIAAARFGTGTAETDHRARSERPGLPPASMWVENEADRLDAVRLSSGAAEAAQDAQLVRGQAVAPSGFGQHYVGDASASNLATASTLELPTLMAVGAWQETFEQILRWFTDRVIEAAVRSGRLGGMVPVTETDDPRPLRELRIDDDREEMERRTGIDLTYHFEMPYPGRRNLPDVQNLVTAISSALDPRGINEPLQRKLLDFLFRHGMLAEDPARDVEEILEAARKAAEAQAAAAAQQPPPQGEPPGAPPPGGAPTDQREVTDQSQYGERRRATPPPAEMGSGSPGALGEAALDPGGLPAELAADVDREFEALLADADALVSGRAPARSNGASPHG